MSASGGAVSRAVPAARRRMRLLAEGASVLERGTPSLPEPAASTASVDTSAANFRLLALEVRGAGLLDRRAGYYAVTIGLTVAAWVGGWGLLVLVGNSWAALGVAVLLGAVFTQLGFLGHDAGHQQAFATRRANRALGLLVANGLIGLSFGWWVPKHDAHHAHPNQVGLDPDVGGTRASLTAGTTSGAGGVCARAVAGLRGHAGRWASRWQAQLFLPLMVLRSAGMQVLGAKRLIRQRDRAAALEAVLIVVQLSTYLGVVLWVLSPLRAVAFVAVQQAMFSIYLGCSFAPNHKAMPLIEEPAGMGSARRQVVTSRNIRGGRLTDFSPGGLDYQIEHHLFPSMPRPNLRHAQRLVRAFCLESGLGYSEASLVGSFTDILRHLHAAGISDATSAHAPDGAGPRGWEDAPA